jgi:hypothetical protein
MILAADAEGREKALAKLLPMQRDDFYGILKAMHDLPVTIRLLDPPLHEFVPHEEDAQAELAKVMGVSLQTVKDRVASLREFNPMLGHRGCRLGVTYPEIYRMQAEAIFQAACQLTKEGVKVFPEIMIPLVGFQDEFNRLKAEVVAVGEKVMAETGVKVGYTVGTMVEVPRAVLVADKIAEEAEFFSFGTNDLTQMGCGFSRDDATTFLPHDFGDNLSPSPLLAPEEHAEKKSRLVHSPQVARCADAPEGRHRQSVWYASPPQLFAPVMPMPQEMQALPSSSRNRKCRRQLCSQNSDRDLFGDRHGKTASFHDETDTDRPGFCQSFAAAHTPRPLRRCLA